jgi:hypothetical protein
MAERCDMTDLLKDQCAHCKPKPPTPPRDTSDYGPWFNARFDGDCDDCGASIYEGDEIRSDGAEGWLCERCGEGDA